MCKHRLNGNVYLNGGERSFYVQYIQRYPAKIHFLQRRTQNCHVTREISIQSSLKVCVCFPKLKYKTCKLGSTTTMSCVRSECIPYRIYKTFLSKNLVSFVMCFGGLPLAQCTANWLKSLCSIIEVLEVQEIFLV